jgi:hypothetical protein
MDRKTIVQLSRLINIASKNIATKEKILKGLATNAIAETRKLIQNIDTPIGLTERAREISLQSGRGQSLFKRRIDGLSGSMQYCESMISGYVNEAEQHLRQAGLYSPKVSLDDLMHLSVEREGRFRWTLTNDHKYVSLDTSSITLEAVKLGRFRINLNMDTHEYRVVALSANPARSDDTVTHPHVRNNVLCEGESSITLKKALNEGRYFDFFTIIERLLKTYNNSSPFVSLENWYEESEEDSISCADCGYTVSEEEAYYCDSCDCSYCSDCIRSCSICEDAYRCSECMCDCEICNNTVCSRCAVENACNDDECGIVICDSCQLECGNCGKDFCKHCLNDGMCKSCQELINEQQEEEQKETQNVA